MLAMHNMVGTRQMGLMKVGYGATGPDIRGIIDRNTRSKTSAL